MAQVEELLQRRVEQADEQVAHDREAARKAQESSFNSTIKASQKTQRDMDISMRDHREDLVESFFKFSTSSMQALATSPIAAHGLRYFTPVFNAVGLIYSGLKKDRLITTFRETSANAQKDIEFAQEGLRKLNGHEGSNAPPPNTGGAPGILGWN